MTARELAPRAVEDDGGGHSCPLPTVTHVNSHRKDMR